MAKEGSTEEKLRRLELDTLSAQKWGQEGKIEAWVHKYLLSGMGGQSNPEFSKGLQREKRWWNGPLEVNLTDLSPAVGPEPGREYQVAQDYWEARTSTLAQSLSQPAALPPLIVEYRTGALSLRDGNTRLGAMKALGWTSCWIIIWYNSEEDFQHHSHVLFG